MRRPFIAQCIAVFAIALIFALYLKSTNANNLSLIATNPNGYLAKRQVFYHRGMTYLISIGLILVGMIALGLNGISRLVLRVLAPSDLRQPN
jgi:hypothetical protein